MSSQSFSLYGIPTAEAFGSLATTSSLVLAFRADYPEFANATTYADTSVGTFLSLATMLCSNQLRWATLWWTGVELVAAHYLVLQARDAAATIPGAPFGLQASKSVADLSVSYDYAKSTYEGAGFWNLTTYGQRFYALARMIGAGGIQTPNFGVYQTGWAL